jgi:hypothetical protein
MDHARERLGRMALPKLSGKRLAKRLQRADKHGMLPSCENALQDPALHANCTRSLLALDEN